MDGSVLFVRRCQCAQPYNAWFPGPIRAHNPNGTSIGSAVLAWLTVMTNRDRLTNRRYSVCNNSTTMRPNNNNNYTLNRRRAFDAINNLQQTDSGDNTSYGTKKQKTAKSIVESYVFGRRGFKTRYITQCSIKPTVIISNASVVETQIMNTTDGSRCCAATWPA